MVVCPDSHVLNTVVANPTLPKASEGQTDIENKEVGANSEHRQPVTADKVTAFNPISHGVFDRDIFMGGS